MALLSFIIGLSNKAKNKQKGKITINKINEQFDEIAATVNKAIQTKSDIKADKKRQKKANKKAKSSSPKRIFVIHFNGDIKASAVTALRQEVTAILLTAAADDRVLCCLESPGGMVNAYGLAASQLQRLKKSQIKLTVAVDKIAASGGYMMACVADEIIAAPFSIIGSIGVVAQLPNFHRFLEKKNIDFEQLTAGQYKRTLTVFGKNTEKGRQKMQEDINLTHELFKSFINQYRQQVNIDQVATGEHWYGSRALELNLIDSIETSDDYILNAKQQGYDIYTISHHLKKPWSKRFTDTVQLMLHKFTNPGLSA